MRKYRICLNDLLHQFLTLAGKLLDFLIHTKNVFKPITIEDLVLIPNDRDKLCCYNVTEISGCGSQ